MTSRRTEVLTMSPDFEKIKGYYDSRRWGKKAVRRAVDAGKITAEEYELITKEVYVNDERGDD